MKKKSKRVKLLNRMMFSMLVLSVVQVAVIALVMTLSGEFGHIRMFSYNSVLEKTANRKGYVENLLSQKTALVYETSAAVNSAADGVLERENRTADELKSDRKLSSMVLDESAEALISLLRRDMVNDAFIIIDSDDPDGALNALYLRDTDANENSSDNSDIFIEAGSAELSKKYGFPLDRRWSRYISCDEDKLGFFRETIDTCRRNPDREIYKMGLWSPFSPLSDGMDESMRYTLPLVASDSTVYGAVGIGLMKKTVLGAMPASDFFDDSACYVLGADLENKGSYDILTHSGPVFNRLVDRKTVLDTSRPAGFGLYDFTSGAAECIGSVQELSLYVSGSPYRDQKWALISVADKEKTLNFYTAFLRIFVISVLVTLAAGSAAAFALSRSISRPISRMVKSFDNSRKNNSLVSLKPSGVAEIDDLAAAAAELQAGALEYGSRVSKIITMTGEKLGVFLYDARSETVFLGESLIRLLGLEIYTGKDATVPTEEFKRLVAAVDRENQIMGLGIFDDGDIFRKDTAEMELDGRWFRFSITRDGKNIVGLVQDITDNVTEKKNIAKVKDDEYTSKLLEANRTLSDAYAVAKQANNAKTDFLSRMSHDIRTPMNAIIGMTAIAKANIGNEEKLIDCLDKITVSENYLLSIINEVLDMSKIESGKFVLTEEKFSIRAAAEGIIGIIRHDSQAKKQELSFSVGEIAHEYAVGDEVRLKQALANILTNAVKYTPEGGKISFTVSEKPVNQKMVGMYEFVISDNGIGMSEEYMEKLYEPFERAEDIRTSKEVGTGLGMPITKNIVEMMDGEIIVRSKEGEGSTFTVRVLLKLAEGGISAEAEEQTDTSDADFTGKKVLIAEDNELNREIICDILSMMNFVIETAENGSEAVDKFSASAEHEFDIVLMDVQMPVMNGHDASRRIRELDRADSDVPIIAMTANAFAEDVRDAKNAGMNEHIAKPIDLEKLTRILKKYIFG